LSSPATMGAMMNPSHSTRNACSAGCDQSSARALLGMATSSRVPTVFVVTAIGIASCAGAYRGHSGRVVRVLQAAIAEGVPNVQGSLNLSQLPGARGLALRDDVGLEEGVDLLGDLLRG